MSLLQPASGVTIASNGGVATATTFTITGDVSTWSVQAGMTLSIGSRNGETSPSKVITSWVANGTTGATVTVAEAFPAAYSGAAFVINTLAFSGSMSSFATGQLVRVVNAQASILGVGTSIDSTSKTLTLDRQNDGSGSFGRVVYSVLGRTWFQTIHLSPTTGTHRWAVQTSPDGTTFYNSISIEGVTGGIDFLSTSTDVTSASTCDIGAVFTRRVNVTGTSAITSFGSGANKERLITFAGALTLTNSASLKLPGRVNITTAAGDMAYATSDASGNWTVWFYTQAAAIVGAGSRTAVGDVSYTVLSTDRYVGISTALTAARTFTLPAASSVPGGVQVRIQDEAGGVSAANTLTVARTGTDTIDGATSVVVASAYADVVLVSDGNSKWTTSVLPVARGGTGISGPSAAYTVRGNPGGAAASPQDFGMGALATILGSQQQNVVAKSAAYTAVAGDVGKTFTCTNSFTLGLTAPGTLGNGWSCWVKNAGTGVITLSPASGNIDGATSKTVYPGQSVRIICDGTNFTQSRSAQDGGMVAYTPTISAQGGGTYTSTSSSVRYQFLTEKVVLVIGSVTVSNVGTGTGAIVATLPFTLGSLGLFIGNGRETAVNGKQAQIVPASTTSFSIVYYDNTNTSASGVTFYVNLLYEVA